MMWPSDLEVMTDEEMRHSLALIAGLLAHRMGDYEAAEVLRRIATALLAPVRKAG